MSGKPSRPGAPPIPSGSARAGSDQRGAGAGAIAAQVTQTAQATQVNKLEEAAQPAEPVKVTDPRPDGVTELAHDVLRVKRGRVILWPGGAFRGAGEGLDPAYLPEDAVVPYTVRRDDPYVVGFEGNLEPAPSGSKAVPRSSWPRQFREAVELPGSPVAEFLHVGV